jgi:Ca2+:H+ antiporter
VNTARRGEIRSASLASSRHRGGARRGPFSEEDEDEAAERERYVSGEDGDDADDDDDDEDAEERDDENHTPRMRDQQLEDDDPVTLKERQSLINDEHPFGLPIWKPALYRKSRTVTREAETALHGVPSPTRDLLLPGNILWTILFGWWLSICIIIPSFLLSIIPFGGNKYSPVVYGLGWYLFWPFGRYVEGDLPPSPPESRDEANEEGHSRRVSEYSTTGTIRPSAAQDTLGNSIIRAPTQPPSGHTQSTSWNSAGANERTSLLPPHTSTSTSSSTNIKSYGALPNSHNYGILPTPSPTTHVKERWAQFWYYWFLTINVISQWQNCYGSS